MHKKRLNKSIFGYDLFISYSRQDSLDYAYRISRFFMEKGFECYLDQLSSTTPGNELPDGIKKAVSRSTAFVLIGSPGARQSLPIDQEIAEFLAENKNQPLIPVNIDGTCFEAVWFPRIEGLALIDETLENLRKGQPADDVTSRILDALQFTKKGKRLRTIAISTICTILVIAIGLSAIALFQASRVVKAKDDLKKVSNERDKADEATLESKKKAAIAQKLAQIAQSDRIKSERLKNAAVEQAETAQRLAAQNLLAAKKAQFERFEEEKLKETALKKSDNAQKEATANLKVAEYRATSARQFLQFVEQGVEGMYSRPIFSRPVANMITEKDPLTIYMYMDRSNLSPKSILLLDSLSDYIKTQPESRIQVDAYTSRFAWYLDPEDERPDEDTNSLSKRTEVYSIQISQRLGEIVGHHLAAQGIPLQDIRIRGYGKTRNKYVMDMMNNVVEIYLIKK